MAAPQEDTVGFILETRALTKEFKGFVAVNRVDLKVRRQDDAVSVELLRTSGGVQVVTFAR